MCVWMCLHWVAVHVGGCQCLMAGMLVYCSPTWFSEVESLNQSQDSKRHLPACCRDPQRQEVKAGHIWVLGNWIPVSYTYHWTFSLSFDFKGKLVCRVWSGLKQMRLLSRIMMVKETSRNSQGRYAVNDLCHPLSCLLLELAAYQEILLSHAIVYYMVSHKNIRHSSFTLNRNVFLRRLGLERWPSS